MLFSIKDGSFKSSENGAVKLSAKEAKWTSLEVGTHPTLSRDFDFNMISGPLSYQDFPETGP